MNNISHYNAIRVSKNGIIIEWHNANIYIDFDDCAQKYAAEKGLQSSRCVAERDITTLSFTFYTCPKTKVIFKKHPLMNIIDGKSAVSKFTDLQKAIIKAGYTSYDLS